MIQPTKLLVVVDGFLSMRPRKRLTAARSLVRFSLLGSALLAILGFGSWRYFATSPANSDSVVNISIPEATSVLKVGQILFDQKLIRSPRFFQLYVRLHKLSIQAGDYQLVPGNIKSLAESLTQGKKQEIKVTIPEGFRREQIAELLSTKLGINQSDFNNDTKNLEGTLFPDTYYFAKDANIKDIISTLTNNYSKKTSSLNLTPNDIILASIVERETLTSAEKPVVAGILKKRLEQGWALEVDATIQYIMGKPGDWWPTPLLGDRQRRSPYNTYINSALPPGPISNPGLDSLSAVANPKETSYYFYLHDQNGLIHYAATNQEHEDNIAKYINSK